MKGYETLERVKLICDEKEKQFHNLSCMKETVFDEQIRDLMAHFVWRMFFDFQLELLEASEKEGCARDPLIHGQFLGKFPPNPEPYGGRDRDQMEAAAVKAEEPVIGKPTVLNELLPVTNHFFYPQDISEAQEGDIWHDLDGRPHFCLGDGWIEARGFKPNCGGDQLITGECHNGHSFGPFNSKSGDFAGAKSSIPKNSIDKFRLVKID